MTPSVDEFESLRERPRVVEDAVRTALRDAIAWRLSGGNAPRAAVVIAAAVAAATVHFNACCDNAAQMSRTLAAVRRAAHNFTRSRLFQRLMTVPVAQLMRFASTPSAADAIVRDRCGRLHAITVTARSDPFVAGEIATRLAAATSLNVVDRLRPLRVHVYSLTTRSRHVFERDVVCAPHHAIAKRVA